MLRGVLLIHRRGRVEQQSDEILDLLLRERAGIAQARHLRAEVVRLRVIDLAVDVLLYFGTIAADRAEAVQARSDRAERRFLGRELVAVVAAAVAGRARLVAPGEAAAALGDALAALPAADEIAARERDRFHLIRFECLGELCRRFVAALGAHALQSILHHAIHAGLSPGVEVALQDFFDFIGLDRRRRRRPRKNPQPPSRLVPGPR